MVVMLQTTVHLNEFLPDSMADPLFVIKYPHNLVLRTVPYPSLFIKIDLARVMNVYHYNRLYGLSQNMNSFHILLLMDTFSSSTVDILDGKIK